MTSKKHDRDINIPCAKCAKTAATFTIDEQMITYKGATLPDGRTHTTVLPLTALANIESGDYEAAEAAAREGRAPDEDRPALDLYCKDCKAFYCLDDYKTTSKEFGGMDVGFGYTILIGTCPKGHTHHIGTYNGWSYG